LGDSCKWGIADIVQEDSIGAQCCRCVLQAGHSGIHRPLLGKAESVHTIRIDNSDLLKFPRRLDIDFYRLWRNGWALLTYQHMSRCVAGGQRAGDESEKEEFFHGSIL
jgi:hypothetical protein